MEPKWKTETRFRSSRLLKAMVTADLNGVVQPCFRAAGLSFGLRPGPFRGWKAPRAAAISVARLAPIPAYLGRVSARGRFLPSQHCRKRDVAAIRAVIENPRRAAEVHAQFNARCACCGRPLAVEDYATGIGPRCLENWGWRKK